MCTVTYIPQPENGFILTSNRDENAARSPQNLSRALQEGVELIFPRDTAAGGTWIAASDDCRVVCVLNGAFEKHQHRPPYRRSRGLMVLDFFTFPASEVFFENYDFDGIEPFTMVVVDREKLFELRWDEQKKHLKSLDSRELHIWSSATLYPKEIQERRHGWFDEWWSGREDFSAAAILDFHQNGGEKDTTNGFLMNRNGLVQTVSITQIAKHNGRIEFIYNDLLRNEIKREELLLVTAPSFRTAH